MIETGIAITGINVERQSRRNKNIINTTRPKAIKIVSSTSLSVLLTKVEKSNPKSKTISGGTSVFNCSSLFLNSFEISITFAPA